MSVVEDIDAVLRVVREAQRLQAGVERRLRRYDVDGGLAGPGGDGEVFDPFLWSWKKKKKKRSNQDMSVTLANAVINV